MHKEHFKKWKKLKRHFGTFNGNLELGNFGILAFWNLGTLEVWNFENFDLFGKFGNFKKIQNRKFDELLQLRYKSQLEWAETAPCKWTPYWRNVLFALFIFWAIPSKCCPLVHHFSMPFHCLVYCGLLL